jgi:hypothetical protein
VAPRNGVGDAVERFLFVMSGTGEIRGETRNAFRVQIESGHRPQAFEKWVLAVVKELFRREAHGI